MAEKINFKPRTYPVTLNCKEIGLVAEALALFQTTAHWSEAEDVDRLHQLFDGLYDTAQELEPM